MFASQIMPLVIVYVRSEHILFIVML